MLSSESHFTRIVFCNDTFVNIYSGRSYIECTFDHVNCTNSSWVDCKFTKCKFTHRSSFVETIFRGCQFYACTFSECELSAVKFFDCKFENGCEIKSSNLINAHLIHESTEKLSFFDCKMQGSHITGHQFYELSNPKLKGKFCLFDSRQGGFGTIYVARSLEDNSPVAIKVLRTGVGCSQERLQRFKNEFLILKNLNSNFVVRAYDACLEDDPRFLILEYIQGATIGNLIETEAKFDDCTFHRIFETAFYGIRDIHRGFPGNRVLHRDISWQNIIVGNLGDVKYIDFGLSKLYHSASSTWASVLGIQRFLAPEVIETHRSSKASDLYSLGVCLFDLSVPEDVHEEFDFLMERRVTDYDVRQTTIPEPYRSVLIKCLQPNPHTRIRDATEAISILICNQPNGYVPVIN